MGNLYREWNKRINLVSRKDIEALYINHILHSLAIARFISFRPGGRILDAGTGGGFPGIPLSVYYPEASFTLVDSTGKKIKAVMAIATKLKLNNVSAIQDRIENVTGIFDFAVTRAVARLNTLYKWLHGKISSRQNHDRPNGIICLKGGDLEDELAELDRDVEIIDIGNYFSESFFETKKIVYIPVDSQRPIVPDKK